MRRKEKEEVSDEKFELTEDTPPPPLPITHGQLDRLWRLTTLGNCRFLSSLSSSYPAVTSPCPTFTCIAAKRHYI